MRRRALALITLVLALAGPAAAQPVDMPPSTPTDLVANAYSGTAGGIRWSRSSDDRGAVVGYEIARDGTVLDVRDTLSYVDRSLVPATNYTYAVTAIDNAGQRSGTATIRLTTAGGAPPEELAAPTGLRASVYSATAAEIFWTRPTTFGLVYEVGRDGVLVATTGGTSYFDDTLSSARTYAYEVVAIDREGRRSAASSVSLETPGPAPGRRPTQLPMPTGLRGEVYSATALELFWERPLASSGVMAFELFRDGRYVRRVQGPSAFEDGLRPGTVYRYNVVAIGGPGGRSEPSTSLTLRTRDEPDGDVSGDGGAAMADRLALQILSSDAPGSEQTITRYVYDEEGFLVRTELAAGFPESVFMADLLSYDDVGRRAERRTFVGEAGAPETALRLFTSRYDDRGRWLGEDLRSPPDAPVSLRYVHGFDNADRIVSRETRDTDGGVGFRVTYAYDETGRLVEQQNHDAEGRLVARQVFDYVDDGDLLSTSIHFDESGSESARSIFVYDSGPCDPSWLESVNRHFCVPR